MDNNIKVKSISLFNKPAKTVKPADKVSLVDLYKLIDPVDESAESLILNPANSNRRDGMHFNAKGNQLVAENVAHCCRKYYPEARRIVCLGDSLTYGVYMPGKGTAEIDAMTYPGILNKLLNTPE